MKFLKLFFVIINIYNFCKAHNYCNYSIEKPSHISTIDDKDTQSIDYERYIPLIKKYSPIIYLHSRELHYPIKVEELFTSGNSYIRDIYSHKTIVEAGKVTMQKIYELYKKSDSKQEYYFELASCLEYGSDPKNNSNKNGILNTPVYVITFEQDDKLYIQYLFLYGFNAPYSIGGLFSEKSTYFAGWRGAHQADLEHMTLEFDKNSRTLLRIYFSAHGRYDGMWLDWEGRDIEREGTHPVIFISKGSHGVYPRAGVYRRALGFANDITNKGIRWEPRIVRIYKEDDSRFKPEVMGWIYHAGEYGNRGVNAACNQSWFCNAREDRGKYYSNKLPFSKY